MDDPKRSLNSAANEVLAIAWSEFAKEGTESAIFAPLAPYPNSAAWLAESMGKSPDYTIRKLAARLAEWVCHARHLSLLSSMLDHERALFHADPESANSVGEDIMFAATRWAQSADAQVRSAGINVLLTVINDALHGTPWNTVKWAVANLHYLTDGKHEIFAELAKASKTQLQGQEFLQNIVGALKQNDTQALRRAVAKPSERCSLPTTDPNYQSISRLWKAAAAAEATLG